MPSKDAPDIRPGNSNADSGIRPDIVNYPAEYLIYKFICCFIIKVDDMQIRAAVIWEHDVRTIKNCLYLSI